MAEGQEGFYSSTSGTYFADEAALKEHYQSDLHRYNLKRKVAGLPPVTKEWFDARKEQLTLTGGASEVHKVYYDPLTRKKFSSRNTYLAATASKKYKDAVKRSGVPAPPPIISNSNQPPPPMPTAREAKQAAAQPSGQPAASAPLKSTRAPLSHANSGRSAQADADFRQDGATSANEDSMWESASDEDEGGTTAADSSGIAAGPSAAGNDRQLRADAPSFHPGAAPLQPGGGTAAAAGDAAPAADPGDASTWEEWDVRRSLFDNHVSPDLESNLDYMFKKFGFFIPDAEYLRDPEGLIKYLGAKLQYGHVPVGARGDDDAARQFASLHAVQRHMVDRNACRLAWEDNEEEYDDFYDYSALDAQLAQSAKGQQLMAVDGNSDDGREPRLEAGGLELSLPAAPGASGGRRVLGNRSFAVYYRQRHPALEQRRSVSVNAVLARYRALNIALQTPTVAAPVKAAQRASRRSNYAEEAAVVKDTANRTRRQVQGPGGKQR